MTVLARYVHTNLVARDWRRLASFYAQVFGCQPVPPERHLDAAWVERATGVAGAAIQGIHLRLPGYGSAGPTLEIFQYNESEAGEKPSINRPGFAHLAFAVADVAEALKTVRAAGGGAVGELVEIDVPGVGSLTFVYATDPEGNIIELQKWASQKIT